MENIVSMLMGNVRGQPWLSDSHEQDASSMHVASSPGAAKVQRVELHDSPRLGCKSRCRPSLWKELDRRERRISTICKHLWIDVRPQLRASNQANWIANDDAGGKRIVALESSPRSYDRPLGILVVAENSPRLIAVVTMVAFADGEDRSTHTAQVRIVMVLKEVLGLASERTRWTEDYSFAMLGEISQGGTNKQVPCWDRTWHRGARTWSPVKIQVFSAEHH